MRTYALMPKDGRKSFYNKAVVRVSENGAQTLRSYTTDVARITPDGKVERLWTGWSATTGRHIAAFCGMNKKEFTNLPLAK